MPLNNNFGEQTEISRDRMSLNSLPYDLLFNVAQSLALRDIYALQLTCKSLHDFVATRPVYRNLAVSLLRRCRALPLAGFQRLSDLSTEQLLAAVMKATRLENAWLSRTPRPSTTSPYSDGPPGGPQIPTWYKVISAPPNEEVDWLSPITSSYSLCATKSGKVVCWDIRQDVCLAEWDPNERWELWKCRVDFDIRTVFFTMAKVVHKTSGHRYDDRVMEFVLMKLEFHDFGDSPCTVPPVFSRITAFRTIGVVMNVFLLDPSSRLLSAFVWVASSNTIGLYALLDWDKEEYVFVDTGVECSMSSNWSCILYRQQIVIHSEESDVAFQYFYPISALQRHTQQSSSNGSFVPSLSTRLTPSTTMSGKFIFPPHPPETSETPAPQQHMPGGLGAFQDPLPPTPPAANNVEEETPASNPFPFPPWYPESAHFVRQWWPTLPTVPRLSCTVVLLANHDPETHRTRYVLAQHYFKVPLSTRAHAVLPDQRITDDAESHAGSSSPSASRSSSSAGTYSATADDTDFSLDDDADGAADDAMLRIWYVSKPFEVVCVLDGMEEDGEDDTPPVERPRPLMAVDFGHAVWVEYVDDGNDDTEALEAKRLRFVSFPPVTLANDELTEKSLRRLKSRETEGSVWTLEIPEELDLDTVETINIDQSQGAVIISVKEGKIFILCYE